MTPRAAKDREAGIALVAVLWVITSLALLLASLDFSVRGNARIVRNNFEALALRAQVDAGMEIAAARLRDTNPVTRWTAGGPAHIVRFESATLRIRIEDASARLDLNTTAIDLIERLLTQFTNADRSQAIRRQIEQRRKQAQRLRHRAFIDTTQLLELDGMTFALYRNLAPFLTVHSRNGRINPASASREVLASLPRVTPEKVETALDLQAAASRGATPILATLREARRWLTQDGGPVFIVTVNALSQGRRSGVVSQAVLLMDLGATTPYHLLSWRADAASR